MEDWIRFIDLLGFLVGLGVFIWGVVTMDKELMGLSVVILGGAVYLGFRLQIWEDTWGRFYD